MKKPPTDRAANRNVRTTSSSAAAVSSQSSRREAVDMPQTQVRPVRPNEIDQAMRVLVFDGSHDPLHLRRRVSAFKELALQEQYDLSRQTVALQGGKIIHAALFVANPGSSAFVHISRPDSALGDAEIPSELAVRTLNQTCQWAFEQGAGLLQVILDPLDKAGSSLCLECGFGRMTDLIYMFRFCHPESPWPVYSLRDGMSWLTYQDQTHEQFKRVIAETYCQSLDCPELGPLRGIEDVIAGHKAVGRFDPGCWNLLLRDQEPIAVLLLTLSRSSDSMELTYMGVVAHARKAGLGQIMLSQALTRAADLGAQFLALAVDCRNHPAYHLYSSFGFNVLQRRTIMYKSSRLSQ